MITKHHSGYTNWPSATAWNWNTVDTGPHMDLVGMILLHLTHKYYDTTLKFTRNLISESQTGALAKAIKSRPDIHFGVYFSQFEWYHPLFLEDKNNSFKTQYYVKVAILHYKNLFEHAA